jgi:hypothetical protein
VYLPGQRDVPPVAAGLEEILAMLLVSPEERERLRQHVVHFARLELRMQPGQPFTLQLAACLPGRECVLLCASQYVIRVQVLWQLQQRQEELGEATTLLRQVAAAVGLQLESPQQLQTAAGLLAAAEEPQQLADALAEQQGAVERLWLVHEDLGHALGRLPLRSKCCPVLTAGGLQEAGNYLWGLADPVALLHELFAPAQQQ